MSFAIGFIVAALIAVGGWYVGTQYDGSPDLNEPEQIFDESEVTEEPVVNKTTIQTKEDAPEEDTPEDVADDVVDDVVVSSSRTIDLSGRGLTKAPGNIFNETNTEELNLSNNQLDGALQAEVRHLQNLRVLDLSDNQFTGVPAEVGQLSKLEILDLSNNKLTGLPHELGNLSNLKLLNLRGNQYSEFDLNIIRQGLPSNTRIETD